jgi:2-oxoglutarate ferredoxin oxidoreductase subunit alpha
MVKSLKNVEDVVIRFAGDSGDGMQLTGTRFTETTAIFGNDLSTLPDYPAEIRAPAGSLAGVSVFQLHFSSRDIHTPGDNPDVLVAMNPAALKVTQIHSHQRTFSWPGTIQIPWKTDLSRGNTRSIPLR